MKAHKMKTKSPKLPDWDLRDLYSGIDAPELGRDLKAIGGHAERFRKAFEGKVARLSGLSLARAIADYEKLHDQFGRIGSYAQLVFAADMSNPKIATFYQTMDERLNDLSSRILFFTLELNRIPESAMQAKLKDKRLRHYQPWLRDLRVFRAHQLSDPLEKLLHEKVVAGRNAWVRLFDEQSAAMRVTIGAKQLTVSDALEKLSSPKPGIRRTAAKALAKVFAENQRLFATITNTLAKDKEIEDRWRQYADPAASRHLANQVEPEVVAALVSAVRQSYPRLSHRYYRLKAKWLKRDRLDWWDRNAPLPEAPERPIPWPEARAMVLDAYRRFSPKMATQADAFFVRRWIDAAPRPGKAGGAFSHPTVPSVHPYILVNYHGKTRDVMTLAHELGHGVHQVLAAGQGALMADTPLTLAETASVFGEQLVFRSLLDGASPRRRRLMLAAKVEDMLNTVIRQIAFYEFERSVHAERAKGELTAERLGQIWLDVQRQSLGPAIRLDDDYRNFWSYIPHFVHSPFYVYAYAFGDCLVNALYARYREQPEGFQAKYLAMLQAGGTLRHKELLAPFDLDASDPGFWAKGLDVISAMIDELELA
jgi:oligoendopeptidase F